MLRFKHEFQFVLPAFDMRYIIAAKLTEQISHDK